MIEAKRKLNHFQLKTGLTKNPSPVALSESDVFPEIGYLTTNEAEGDAKQLATIDLRFEHDLAIEADRRQFASVLQAAADRNGAVYF